MTYLYKLAKRLALVPAVLFTGTLLGSCSQGTTQEYLGPDPTKLPPTTNLIGLSINPRDPQLVPGDSVHLEAIGWVSSGSGVPVAVTWSATGGTVSSTGWFRSAALGAFRVRAVSAGTPSYTDSVVVTVRPPTGYPRLDVTPADADLPAGTQQQFTAVHLTGDGTSQYPPVIWSAVGGTITPGGLFTNAPGATSYKVTAHLSGGALSGQSAGRVLPPVLTDLELDAPEVELEPTAARQFTVQATWSDGSTGIPALSWSAQGGAISNGRYTAGATSGTYLVIVSSSQHARADTSKVNILSRVVRIRLTPGTASLALGASLSLDALALRADGTERPATVEWTAQGGVISKSGTYTAGNTPGQYLVVGTYRLTSGQVVSDTAHLQLGAAPAVLNQLTVKPDTSIQVGSTVQFRTEALWSDGSDATPALTWSATGGSIDAGGRYTAGSTPGTYRVMVSQQSGTKADTATVTVTAAPVVTVKTFTIAPETGILAAGLTRQFSATLNWSDGQVHPANISWVSAGGTITQNGLYTAGSVAGTFLIVATCSCGAADTASVTIPAAAAPPAATLTQLVLSPSAATIPKGASQPFVVTATWSDGATTVPPLTFTATGGTVTPAGVYTAGTTAGTFQLIAKHQGGTKADTSVITIPAGVTLSQLVLNPSSVSLAAGATRQFAVSGTWSDGSSVAPSVTYSATGGTITPAGLYTAGSVAGSHRVVALHTGGTKADTSVVTIGSATPPPPIGSAGDLVVIPDPSVAFIIGPQIRALTASSPWPFFDENMNTMGVQHGNSFSANPGVLDLTGTISINPAVDKRRITGSGTRFTQDLGKGGTLYIWRPSANSFEVVYNVTVVNDTEARLAADWFGTGVTGVPAKYFLNGFDGDGYTNSNYYDLGLALYTAYYRTGNATHLTNARKVADSWFSSGGILDGKNLNFDQSYAPRNASLGGLMLRALDGRPEMWPWITEYVRYEFQMWVGSRVTYSGLYYGIRDGGYMLLYAAWLAKVHPDPVVRAEFLQKAQNGAANYYARLQYPDGSWRWVDDLVAGTFMQPFMVGLLLDGMIAVHRLTGDAVVKSAIVKSVDNLWAVAYRGSEPVSGVPGVNWRGMWYNVYGTGCATGCGATALDQGWDTNTIREVRQLNPLIVQAFGYAFQLTGDPKYRQQGDEIFSATFGKGRGPGADAFYSLADFRYKEFNANYRSAGRYLAWRLDP